MNFKIALTVIALSIFSNANAGWFDDIVDSGKEKINKVKDRVKDSDAISSALSNEDIIAGLKEALIKGVGYAVDNLGQADGFLGNTDVKIPRVD